MKSITLDKTSKHWICIFLCVLYMISNFFWLILVSRDSFKRKTLTMAETTMEGRVRAVWKLVPGFLLHVRQLTLPLILLFVFSSILFWILSNSWRLYFNIFLLYKCNAIYIGNPKQSESSEQKLTKPEMFVIFNKNHGLGSKPVVTINTSFLSTWKLGENQSPRRQN